jgi:membrane protein YdbS with pleckstrin-like domain
MPPLNERLQVDQPSPDVELIRKLEKQNLGAYLCVVDIAILISAYWVAMQASVVIAVTIEIFATLIVTLGIFYLYRFINNP